MIERYYTPQIKSHLQKHPILLLMGAKGVKSFELVDNCIEDKESILLLDGSKKKTLAQLLLIEKGKFHHLFEGKTTIIFDEAQYFTRLQELIEEILALQLPIHLVLICSYEPIIDKVLREVLKMEGLEMNIFPPLFQELANFQGLVEFDKRLEERLVFGNYPEVIEKPQEAEKYLVGLLKNSIFKQLNPKERINKGYKLIQMLQHLAFEIGNPISYLEIGLKVGLDNETVERYIDLLEKAYILKKIPCYFNHHKYELKKTHTIFFMDNGIRNAVIKNFHPFEIRNDIDALWKNWLISERIKWNEYNQNRKHYYFWRTHTKQQMDFIEVHNDKIMAYKSIWDKRKKPKFPASFKKYYPEAGTFALNRSTYWGFLSKK